MNPFLKTETEIIAWLEEMKITNYTLHENAESGLTVDVNGDVNLFDKKLASIPVQFGIVTGNFTCGQNNLATLLGAPHSVGGWFDCSVNQLTSLQFSPTEVGAQFHCEYNQLTTLKGCPTYVKGYFNCSTNHLTTLDDGPNIVQDNFECFGNLLTTLRGCPEIVGGSFNCCNNALESLEFCPKSVTRWFGCSGNPALGETQYISDFSLIYQIHEKTLIQKEQAVLAQSLISYPHDPKTHKI